MKEDIKPGVHQFKTPRIPPFHSMSVANAWASGHALSMVMLSNPQIAVDCYLNTFTLLFKPMKLRVLIRTSIRKKRKEKINSESPTSRG